MSKFVKDLVELSKHDKVERFRMDSVPMDINTENFDRVGELLVGDRWLKEFVGPPLDDTPESRKRYSQSIGRKRRRFRMVLARNLAVGIYDCDFIEKLTTLEKKLSSGELKASENHEYYSAVMNEETATLLMDEKSRKVTGENNAAAGHGGRYSPYSTKFVGYDGMTSEEKETAIAELHDKRIETVKATPQNNPKRPEYYMSRLEVSEEEAVRMVSESQATFSLVKCIAKYGEKEGRKRWEHRQTLWSETLGNKSIEEQYDIARGKASSDILTRIKSGGESSPTYIYIMVMESGDAKIGYTSGVEKRIVKIESETGSVVKWCKTCEVPPLEAYDIEDIIVRRLSEFSMFIRGEKNSQGHKSTEWFLASEEFLGKFEEVVKSLGMTFSYYG